jgi:hypothetical protein
MPERKETPNESITDNATRVITTAEMKKIDETTNDTWEEAWFRLDPTNLKICIRILGASIASLEKDEQGIVGEVIGCMAAALSRSEKQQLRDGIASGDVGSVLSAVGRSPLAHDRLQKHRKKRGAKVA